jgi:uncharacterized membrane protein YphA (DoxX/SURF4 family)
LNSIMMQICRLLLGTVFLVAGINGYFVIFGLDPFMATSPEAMALFEFDYLLIAEKTLEVVCGLFLLLNRFIPLALSLLSPIIVNILLLHLFLDHSLLLLAILLTIAYVYLLFYFRENFKRLFEKKPSR